ncbi:MAG: amidohydrolase family protein [Nitrospinaceae bacterium]|nr:amidohydrolase family protein [Nitrospinaceae bacterium]MBT3432483.1 amidohydrolase family protein [Nitrospinaceae bacterium]MBT3821146.1 amidohydrolase family protein [Nitrospinaceae bacterium]MBT4095407.1 amidohydrolase family protein [Nitrospinaceae bacterium]MBT4430176.1 amidohydrolase family protein [Nitrospinaceae bacterium]
MARIIFIRKVFTCAALAIALGSCGGGELGPNAVREKGLESRLPSPDFILDTAPPNLNRPARKISRRYEGLIFDTHVHVMNRTTGGINAILPWMNRMNVERLILQPTPNEGLFKDGDDNEADRRNFLKIAGRRGGRFCGSLYLTNWMDEAYHRGYEKADLNSRLERLRKEIDSGTCLGIGEIGPYHFDKKARMGIIHFPLNFGPMAEVAALAEKKDIWLELHTEPRTPDGRSFERELFGGIAYLFRRYPKLKLILSHTGMTTTKNARSLLKKYPNLMMNLKMVRPGGFLSWDHLGPISNAKDELFEDWARLMEEMPRRFMIGTDSRFGTEQYTGKRYGRGILKLRNILGTLAPAASNLIAHGNAKRLFGAPGPFEPNPAGGELKKRQRGKRKSRRRRRRNKY